MALAQVQSVALAMAPKKKNGRTRRLLAKITGMTPAVFTLSGRNCLCRRRRAGADVLGRLLGMRSPALGDGDDRHDDDDEQQIQHHEFSRSSCRRRRVPPRVKTLCLNGRFRRRASGGRGRRARCRHDDEADAVADAVLVDLLASHIMKTVR